MCRSDYLAKKPLLLIFHDPPELQALPDPQNAEVQLHNTFLVGTFSAASCMY